MTKGKLFVSYEHWHRERHIFLSKVYVYISDSANERISMYSMQKSGQK